MKTFYLLLLLIPFSVAFRYQVELDQAAKRIGIRLASAEFLAVNKDGFRDAVTPPESTKWFYLVQAFCIGIVGWLAWGEVVSRGIVGVDWKAALLGIAVFYVSSLFGGLLGLPKADSAYFARYIFRSLGRRYADYVRDGDTVRAAAMSSLIGDFLVHYGQVITTGKLDATEKIINKSDADYMFSLDRAGWESYAVRMTHPEGWQVQRTRHDTGTSVFGFDPKTNTGLSVQALYVDDTSPPAMVIVGSYLPIGRLPPFTPELKARFEQVSQSDLGSGYTVTASHSTIPDFDRIDLTVTRSRQG